MYFNLFQLASLAIIGWIPLIFFPTWRSTRRLAESAFFPTYIAVLYAFGVGALLMQFGPGFIADFGSADGVARLLARQEIAWVAWLHILAFDQVIALAIYRENMRCCYVPMPVQSALLFLTLMFGPLGYLAFLVVRVARLGSRAFGGDEDSAGSERIRPTPQADMHRALASDAPPTIPQILSSYREERGLTATGLVGVGLGLVALVVAGLRGSIVPPEGDLMKPATFDLAVGIFLLSLIPWLPVSGFSEAARRRWRVWMIGLLVCGRLRPCADSSHGDRPNPTASRCESEERRRLLRRCCRSSGSKTVTTSRSLTPRSCFRKDSHGCRRRSPSGTTSPPSLAPRASARQAAVTHSISSFCS